MSQLLLLILATFSTVLCQQDKKDPAAFCGCNMVRDYHADPQPYDVPGERCNYYCRNTRLSYYNKHMNKEIRVVSVYDDAGQIDLILCNGNTTALTKPIVLYLTSYDPINWIINSNDTHIVENIVIAEIYAEYLRGDKGKSTVTLDDDFIESADPKIIVKKADWNGYGKDEESNQILYDVQDRYNLELYSFCGGYSGDMTICVGEQDIVGNKYLTDNQYEKCDIPLSQFAQSMLYVLTVFSFWCVLCCGIVCVRKMWRKRKEKAIEKQRLERLKQEQYVKDERNRKQKERIDSIEMEKIRRKNESVYVGDVQGIETIKIQTDSAITHNIYKQSKYSRSDNYQNKKQRKSQLIDDELPEYGQVGNDNKNDEIIWKQPTLSYSAMTCVICLDVLLDNEARKLLCGHKFHTHCIEEYNESNSNCPLCRKKIE